MRDTHRMKEKLELSLDNRQIVGLLIGGLVVVGAVFVLGVMVGKNLSASAGARSAPDLLTALDRKAQQMEDVHPDAATLTFQEELTKKQPPLVALPPEKTVVVQPAPSAEPAAEKKPAPEPEAKPEVKPAVAEAVPAAEKKPIPEPVKPAADEVPTRTSENLKDAFARLNEKPVPKPANAAPNGAYTLQLSASQSRDEAEKFAARLRDRGYAPFIVKADVPGRGTWYRVRMGSFATKDAASRYLQDLKRETQLEAFVTANN